MYHFHFDETYKYLQIAYYVISEYLTLICTRIPFTDIKHRIQHQNIKFTARFFQCFSTIIRITHRCVCDNLLHICVFFHRSSLYFYYSLKGVKNILCLKRCLYRIFKHVLIYNFIIFNILKALTHHYDPIFYDFFAAY